MNPKKKLNTSAETWVDLLVCLGVLPCLMSVFPLEEWAAWRAADVAVYLLWVYLCWYLGRRVLPQLFAAGKGRLWSGVALLFLTTVLTFLMSIRKVPFPQEIDLDRPPRLYLYQQAVWVLYIASMGTGLATGILAAKIRSLESARKEEKAKEAVRSDVEVRAAQAVAGETVTVKSGYEDITLPLAAIQYIEARNNYACIHLDNREDVVPQMTLKSLLEILPEGKFVRIHRSYIIPVHRIESRKATSVKLVGVETPLPVGRAHKENLK